MSTKPSQPTPNEQRSDTKNPNNPAHKDAQNNRSRQLNPEDPMNQPPKEAPPSPEKKP
jgi:hypothetical protein